MKSIIRGLFALSLLLMGAGPAFAASMSISSADNTFSPTDITALGTADWHVRESPSTNMLGASLIGTVTVISGSDSGGGQGIHYSWSNGDEIPSAGDSNPGSYIYPGSDGAGWTWTVAVGTATTDVYVDFGCFDTGQTKVEASISDSSSAPVSTTVTCTNGGTSNNFRAHLIVSAASGGQTVTMSIKGVSSATPTFSAIAVAQGAGPAPADAIAVSGPAGGLTGAASSNFTVSANGALTGTVVVTPAGTGLTFSPTTVSISSGSPTGTFTVTPASAGAKTISFTNNASLTNPSNKTYTAVDAIAANDTRIHYAPSMFADTGSLMIASAPGAYAETIVTKGTVTMLLDAATAGDPRLSWTVDGVAYEANIGGDTSLTLASGLSSGSHLIRVTLRASGLVDDRWVDLTNAWRIAGWVIDSDASISAPTPKSKFAMFFTDSIGEGYLAGPGDVSDSRVTLPPQVATVLDAEYAQISFSGQGYDHLGIGQVPNIQDAYGEIADGYSRLDGSGHFTPMPDTIFVDLGTNDTSLSKASVAATIAKLRAAAPVAEINILVPVNGGYSTELSGAVTDARAANDNNVWLIDAADADLIAYIPGGGAATLWSSDARHPGIYGHLRRNARVIDKYKQVHAPAGTSRRKQVGGFGF